MRRRAVLGAIGASVAVAGCDAPARLASLPEKLRGTASFQGLPTGTRIILDGSNDELLGRMAMDALRRELAYKEKTGASALGPATYLAISGGGERSSKTPRARVMVRWVWVLAKPGITILPRPLMRPAEG